MAVPLRERNRDIASAVCPQPIVDRVRHLQALAAARAPMLAFEEKCVKNMVSVCLKP